MTIKKLHLSFIWGDLFNMGKHSGLMLVHFSTIRFVIGRTSGTLDGTKKCHTWYVEPG